ncbi:MAG TPA: nitrate reductase, partial [Betaproteobacteria bacterium]|nr:nitrate reductase [Betaproteobacteria bacterium]
METFKSICCFCGVGCGVLVTTAGGRVTDVRGDPSHPANFGRLCTKGASLHLTAGLEGRALYPELRRRRGEARQRAAWSEALDLTADRFAAAIRRYGPDSVGFYLSGQLLTEDYYVFNKLAKGLIGTNNLDSNSRLCMSSAVAGYKTVLGVDAPPACYDDIHHAQCIFIAGSNTADAHPILFQRIEAARAANPACKLIVADPRKTDTAAAADLHLAIQPGTDVALFNGMLHVLIWEALCDMEYIAGHTEGFAQLKAAVHEYTPKTVARMCGVPEAAVVQAARWFGESGAALSLYCQGLNQSIHGTDNNAALINLHLAAGQIGKPGAGPFSLTGQSNAMGGREVGGMANLLSAHRDPANAADRAEVAKLWGTPSIAAKPGKTAVELFEAAARGEIRALWIACTNPAQSLPNQALVRQALERVDWVVLQEAFCTTETAAYADVLLPAATWPEKEGTATNAERRISRVRAALPPPEAVRQDWEIAVDFAHRLGERLDDNDASRLFPYRQAEEIFNEHRETTRGRDLDITGLSYAVLDSQGPQQWPFPEGATAGAQRLYTDGRFPTASGRAHFFCAEWRPVAEQPDSRYPFHLMTGRIRDQWHGMSRSGRVARLFNHTEAAALAMNPEDMARCGIADGDIVSVKSRRGEIKVKAAVSRDIQAGQLFLPMHWGSCFSAGAGGNALTLEAFDSRSKQPELKHAAVAVEKAALPWEMVVLRQGNAVNHLHRLQPLLQRFTYASLGLAGTDQAAAG